MSKLDFEAEEWLPHDLEEGGRTALEPAQMLCRALRLAPPCYQWFELVAIKPEAPLMLNALMWLCSDTFKRAARRQRASQASRSCAPPCGTLRLRRVSRCARLRMRGASSCADSALGDYPIMLRHSKQHHYAGLRLGHETTVLTIMFRFMNESSGYERLGSESAQPTLTVGLPSARRCELPRERPAVLWGAVL